MSESDRITIDATCPECYSPKRWYDPHQGRGLRGCPNCAHTVARNAKVSFLRTRMAQETPERNAAFTQLLDDVLGYESQIDAEFGCCHEPVDIEFGECSRVSPDGIPAIQSLVHLLHP